MVFVHICSWRSAERQPTSADRVVPMRCPDILGNLIWNGGSHDDPWTKWSLLWSCILVLRHHGGSLLRGHQEPFVPARFCSLAPAEAAAEAAGAPAAAAGAATFAATFAAAITS